MHDLAVMKHRHHLAAVLNTMGMKDGHGEAIINSLADMVRIPQLMAISVFKTVPTKFSGSRCSQHSNPSI